MEIPFIYILVTIIPILLFVYRYFTSNHNYWQKRNIPVAKNWRPIVGHGPILSLMRNIGEYCNKMYRENTTSLIGFYDYDKPCLLIRDPELVKSVLITNFGSFSDNEMVIKEEEEPILAKNPFFTNGNEWKTNRMKLTTSLTGNKLKNHALMMEVIDKKFVNFVNQKIEQGNGVFEVEAKGLFARVTAEICANIGFGVEGHCFDDSQDKESFVAYGKMLVNGFDMINKIKIIIFVTFPWIRSWLKMPFVSKEVENLFLLLVKNSLTTNKTEFQGKNFIDTIIQQEKDTDPSIKNKNIASHMMSFVVDMYETTSSMMSWVCYNLSIHPEVRRKAREEVLELVQKYGGINYDTANNMNYLEQVFHETIRLEPAINRKIKVCTREIELVGSDGVKVLVEPGTRVYIPVGGLHRDPEYWEQPNKFIPERFEKENVAKRSRTVHLPFGEGPRMCPGRNIALLVTKMIMATVLLNYNLELSTKTRLPVEIDQFAILPYVKGGMWIKLKNLK